MTVWFAMDSEYAERLQEITVERIRLTRDIICSHSIGRRQYEDKLQRIHQLDNERDTILSLFQNKELKTCQKTD